jgi:hypothetical protein
VQEAGFEALAAATADEALSILEARGDDVRWCSRTSRCRVRWMACGLRTPFATAGLPSS